MSATLSSRKARAALHTSARISGELLLVLLLTAVVLWILGRMWPVVWPLVVGLLLTTLTWPPTRALRNRGLRPAVAAAVVTVLFLASAAGTVALIAVPGASQSGVRTGRAADGCDRHGGLADGHT